MRKIVTAVGLALVLFVSGCASEQGVVVKREEKPDTITGKPWTYLTIRLKSGIEKVETYTDVEHDEAADCQEGDSWPGCLNPVK